MLKRIVLVLALLVGALAVTQGSSQASPLGASAQAQSAAPGEVSKAQYYYYRPYRPRRFYRPYYRPRYYGGPRFYGRPRYYGGPRFYRRSYFY